MAKPLGKVGPEVSPEQGYASARLVALAHFAGLKRAVIGMAIRLNAPVSSEAEVEIDG